MAGKGEWRVRDSILLGVLVTIAIFLILELFSSMTPKQTVVVKSDPAPTTMLEALNEQRKVINEMGLLLKEQDRDLNLCRIRTDDLRSVLRSLLPLWPGRKQLPQPKGGWPAWPAPGSNRYDYKDLPLIK